MLDRVGGEERRGEAREEFLQHVNFSLHLLHLHCFGSRVIRSQSLHLPKGLQGCVITLSPGAPPDSKPYTICYSVLTLNVFLVPLSSLSFFPQDERLGPSSSIYRNTLIPTSRHTKSQIGVRERRFRVGLLYWQGPASICWHWPRRYREGCREPGE